MNKAYRLIWNRVKELWIVAAETIKGKGGHPPLTIAAMVAATSMLLAPVSAHALPTAPQVINGTANINTSGSAMTITNSANAIINWQGFSIGQNESTRFVQPSALSSVLNRVTGGDPSKILGALQSNGKVLLINQNGILFGPNSRIEVNGLVASTLDITNQDFLAGRMKFNAGPVAGKIENQGTITTPGGGLVYLIAADVTNSGVITAPNGDIMLAAGKEVMLVDSSSPEIAIVVSAPEHQAINLGTLVADAGRIGVYGGIVRQSGRISADSAVMEGGKIFLRATKSIELSDSSVISADGTKGGQVIVKTEEDGKISGTLTARGTISAQGDGTKGSGGFVETSAVKLDLNGIKVKTNGGTWLLDPYDFTIGVDISGENLSTALAGSDVIIQTTDSDATCTFAGCGTGTSGNGDISVNDPVSWNSAKTLTLNAWRNININSSITASHTNGKLSLLYGQGAFASGNTATYSVNAPINLIAGNNFSTTLGSNGTPVTYTVITSLGLALSAYPTDLQGMSGDLSGNYVLGSNIDASPTSTWNSNAGFMPVGTTATPFTGKLDGLGHTISGLTINRPATTEPLGLFGVSSGLVQNIGLVGGSVTGGTTVDATHIVGGLVGTNSGTINNSFSTGSVSGNEDVGGLVGWNIGTISNSYFAGSVSGNGYVGGLVGWNGDVDNSLSGIISNSYSMGIVSGVEYTGGLVGKNEYGTVSNSFWDTFTSGQSLGFGANNGTFTATGKSPEEMMSLATYSDNGWDTSLWTIDEGSSYPYHKWSPTPPSGTFNRWLNLDSTAWLDGSNWSLDHSPASTENVIIGGDPSIIVSSGGSGISFGKIWLKGNLTVDSAVTVGSMNLIDGTLGGSGLFTVSNSYLHTGGTIDRTGDMNVTQTRGNLTFSAVHVGALTLNATAGEIKIAGINSSGDVNLTAAGAITQSAAISGGLLTTSSVGGTILTDENNAVSSFNATNSGTGAITLTNTLPLSITGITQSAIGEITVNNSITNTNEKDISVDGQIRYSGADDATLIFKAGRSISVNEPINAVCTGKLNVTLNAHAGSDTDTGRVVINSSISTNGGSLVIGGGLNPVTTPTIGGIGEHGVEINSSVTSGTGNISIIGNGGAGISEGDGGHGVYIGSSGSVISAATISITGTGGNATDGQYNGGYGVFVAANGQVNSTASGKISIAGTGGSGYSDCGNSGCYGNGGVLIRGSIATLDGAITITGTGGDGTSGYSSGDGVVIDYNTGTVTSTGSGKISIIGTGGNGTVSQDGGYGVVVAGEVTSSGTGNISITGTGGSGAGGGYGGEGVNVDGSVTSSGSGNIVITGAGGNALGYGDGGVGVYIDNWTIGEVTATGTGNLSVTGIGGSGVYGGAGVSVNNAVTTNTGNITITGTGGKSLDDDGEDGVYIDGTVKSTSGNGNITITGTGGNGQYNGGAGVYINNLLESTGSGNIVITGVGGDAINDDGGRGVIVSSPVTSIYGNISITGTGGRGGYEGGDGVHIDDPVSSSSGNITITGSGGSGINGGSGGNGVYLSETVTSISGNISLIGTGGNGSVYCDNGDCDSSASSGGHGVHIDGGKISTGSISTWVTTSSEGTTIGLNSTSGLAVGMTISGTGIQEGTTIASIDSIYSQITLSQSAIVIPDAQLYVSLPISGDVVNISKGNITIKGTGGDGGGYTPLALFQNGAFVNVGAGGNGVYLENSAISTNISVTGNVTGYSKIGNITIEGSGGLGGNSANGDGGKGGSGVVGYDSTITTATNATANITNSKVGVITLTGRGGDGGSSFSVDFNDYGDTYPANGGDGGSGIEFYGSGSGITATSTASGSISDSAVGNIALSGTGGDGGMGTGGLNTEYAGNGGDGGIGIVLNSITTANSVAGGGAITLIGTGGTGGIGMGANTDNNGYAGEGFGGAGGSGIVSTGTITASGDITVVATGGAGGAGVDGNGGFQSGGCCALGGNGGIGFESGSSISTTAGNISITGTGGQGGAAYASSYTNIDSNSGDPTGGAGGDGVYLSGGEIRTSGVTQTITLNGTGGAGGPAKEGIAGSGWNGDLTDGVGGNGIKISDTTINSGAGAMTLTGVGAGDAPGIYLAPGSVIGGATGQTGDITLIADSSLGSDSFYARPYEHIDDPIIQGSGTLTLRPLKSDTTIGIHNGAGDYNINSLDLWAIKSGFSNIIIGNATGTGRITIGDSGNTWDTMGLTPNLTLQNGGSYSDGMDLNGNLIANNLTLKTTGTVIQYPNTGITATNLNLFGADGYYLLTGDYNNVSVLTGNTGGVAFRQENPLTIGWNKLTVSDFAVINTTGDYSSVTNPGNITGGVLQLVNGTEQYVADGVTYWKGDVNNESRFAWNPGINWSAGAPGTTVGGITYNIVRIVTTDAIPPTITIVGGSSTVSSLVSTANIKIDGGALVTDNARFLRGLALTSTSSSLTLNNGGTGTIGTLANSGSISGSGNLRVTRSYSDNWDNGDYYGSLGTTFTNLSLTLPPDFTITSPLAATENITLKGSGNITQSGYGAINASGLELLGSGNYTLDNSGNKINTLAANVGSLKFVQDTYGNINDITIDKVNGTTGITALGDVTLIAGNSEYGGNIIFDHGAATGINTPTGTVRLYAGEAVINNASGTNVIANELVISAYSGIGSVSDSPLNTQVNRLNALNTNSGDIQISNSGKVLTVENFDGLYSSNSYNGLSNEGGNIVLSNDRSILLNGNYDTGIFANGNITVTVSGATSDIRAGGGSNESTAIKSEGTVTLTAGRDVVLGNNSGFGHVVVTGDGTLDINAGRDVTIDNQTFVQSDAGNITINAGRDVSLLYQSQIQLGNGTIDITAQRGQISVVSNAYGILTNGGGITLTADNMELRGPVSIAREATVTLQPYNINTLISVGSGALDATGTVKTLGLDQSELDNISASGLTIGREEGIGKITVVGALSPHSTLTLQNPGSGSGSDGMVISGSLSTAGNLTLNTAGSVTQNAPITAAGLELLGTGADYQLDDLNRVGVLAGNTRSVNFVNYGDLAIGKVNNSTGLTVAGAATLYARQNLELALPQNGDIIVANDIRKSGFSVPTTLWLKADNAVAVNQDTVIGLSDDASGKYNVILNANASNGGAGNILINAGASILTNGGNLVLGGGTSCSSAGCDTGAATGWADASGRREGIFLGDPNNVTTSLVKLDTSGGNIWMKGQGMESASYAHGIYSQYTKMTTGGGYITLDGTGGGNSDTYTYINNGIYLYNSNTLDTRKGNYDVNGNFTSTGAGGMVTLTGTGGNGLDNNYGVYMDSDDVNNSSIKTGGGVLTITGYGGTGAAGFNTGLSIWGTTIDTRQGNYTVNGDFTLSTGVSGGNITLTGTGGTGVTDTYNTGIEMYSANIFSGGGTIDITGTSGVAGTGNIGIYMTRTALDSGAGAMKLQGTGGAGSEGLSIDSGSVIGGITQTGEITLIAKGSGEKGSIAIVDSYDGGFPIIQGTGKLYLQPLENETTIGLAGGAGNFNLDSTALDAIQPGFSDIIIGKTTDGNSTGTGKITMGSTGWTVLLGSANLTLQNAGSDSRGIAIAGNLSVTGNLTLNTTGDLNLTGAFISTPSGNQAINAANINITANTAPAGMVSAIDKLQQITATGDIILTAAAGNGAYITGGQQEITAAGLTLQAAESGSNGFASIKSNGTQNITVNSGGLSLIAGSGGANDTDNYAMIYQAGTTGTTQTININSGGSIVMNGGSTGLTGVGTGHGSRALIEAVGDLQLINFSGTGGAINLTGGTAGSRAYSMIYAPNGSQSITGSPAITLVGGANGGIAGEGNYAAIQGNSTQAISASTISLNGGATGIGNSAFVQAPVQGITVTGDLALNGGGSYSSGISGGGAGIYAPNGSQSITGSPAIILVGGANGGIAGEGNYAAIQGNFAQTIGASTVTLTGGATGIGNSAGIYTNNGYQSITTTGSLTLYAGAGGITNSAFVQAPAQAITVTGDLTLKGGGSSASGSSGGGAGIGGRGGSAPTATDLTLNVTGNLTMTGGTVSGASIGSGYAGGKRTDLNITVGGSVTLNGGEVAGAGVRIGSPSSAVAGGDISVTSTAGDISLNANSSIRTLGNVTIKTTGTLTQTAGSISAAGLELLGAGGTFIMDTVSNNVSTLAADTGTVKFRNDGSFAIGTINETNGITSIGNNVTLITTGTVTQSKSITADGLELLGTGGIYSLDTVSNSVSTLAGSTGTVSFKNTPDLTVGTVNTSGLSSSGSVSLTSGGRITLDQPVSADSYLVLAGASFTNNAGSSALRSSNGWRVYSGSPVGDKIGGLRYAFKQYAATPGGEVLGVGNGLFYSTAPLLTVTLTGPPIGKIYDGTNTATLGPDNYTLGTAINGDVVTLLNKPTAGTYDNKNAGFGKGVTVSGLNISADISAVDAYDKPVYGYKLSSSSASAAIGNINQAQLTASITGTPSKTYDGTTNATLSTSNFSLTGLVAGENITVTQTNGSYNSLHVLAANTVSATLDNSHFAVGSDTLADNYLLPTTASGAGSITAKSLTSTATIGGALTKVYDGTAAATGAIVNNTVSGGVTGDTITLNTTPVTLAYNGSHVVGTTAITATGTPDFTISVSTAGSLTSDYSFTAPTIANATASITPAPLTVTANSAYKTYGAAHNFSGTEFTSSGLQNNETVASVTLASAGAPTTASVTGGPYPIIASNATGGSFSVSDYNIGYVNGQLTVNPATLYAISAALTGTASKTYDGTTTATLTPGNFLLTGFVNSDSATVTKTSGTYSGKNVDNGIQVTTTLAPTDFSKVGSTDLSNYALPTSASGNIGIITPATLTVSATGINKVYDGNTTASVILTDNRITGDLLTLTNSSASFLNKNADIGKTVSVTGINATGTDVGNYTFNTTATTTADITKAQLTVSATGKNKTYDGTTAAAVTLADNRITGDTLTLATSGASFSDKNVATGKTVNVAGISVSGADAGNYTFNTAAAATADITKAQLTVSATGQNKTYDGTSAATVTLADNRITGDVLTIANGGASFTDKNVATGKTVNVAGIAVTGTDAGNYTFNTAAAATADITAKALTVTATGQNKIYDGNKTATVTLADNRITGDVLTIANGGASFIDKNVATGKTVSVSGIAVTGADAGNYTFNTAAATTADITKAQLTVSATGQNKTYNGTTTATVTLADNRITGDTLTLANSGASFIDKNVATGKTVNVAGISVTGADAGNYTFNTAAATTADITAKALTVTATGQNKTYDGTTTATVTLADNRITGDVLTLANSGASFIDKNVATGKTVNVAGISVTGTDAGNYTFNTAAATTADITAKALTVAATGQNKTYDGNTTANPTLTITGGLVGSETVNINATASFNSRNVDAANLITVNSISLADGANGGLGANYSITAGQTVAASITKLASVAWVGSSPGNWSVASNWAGGALPDRANVSNVTIPANTTVTYDTGVDPTTALNTITVGANGGLALAGSTLTVNASLTTPNYVQTGGTLGGTGTVTVSNSFSKSGGVLASTLGELSIDQRSGNLAFSNSQALTLGAVNAFDGNIEIETTGGLTSSKNKIKSSTGSVHLVTHSPLVIGSGGVDAATGVTLEASTPGADSAITVNGAVQTVSGPVAIASYGNVAQNASISGGSVDIGSTTGNITVASGAVTSAPVISYKASAGMISSNPSNFSGSKPNLTAVSVQTTQSADPCVADPLAPGCPGAIQAAANAQAAATAQVVKDITFIPITPVATTGLIPVSLQMAQNSAPAPAPASAPPSTTSSAPASSSDTPPAQTTASANSQPSDSGPKEQAATSGKDSAAKEKEPATKEKEPLAKEKEPAAKENEPAAKEKEPAAKEKDDAGKEKESAAKEKEAAAKEKEAAEKDKKEKEEKEKKEKEKEKEKEQQSDDKKDAKPKKNYCN